ncbi:unnamed protein product [Candida verbasci]|uniref:Phosphatase PP2A regulatory subunit A/Splicing factor 3B subunit 1-like HEAT repeat domain-containing protein n=1 Tax=Candida verbasci TaxID=1227364 RepID=A0A9W4TVX9_9ASCO|nr:unnamed protein product [Candida verbasci]
MSKKSLVGNYSIPDALNKELRREFENDVGIASSEIENEIKNRNDYKKKRFYRNIDLDFEKEKSYKDVMKERDLEREEFNVRKLLKEKESTGELPRKKIKRWDITPEEYEKRQELQISKPPTDELVQTIIDSKIPVIYGIPLTDEILDKILPPNFKKLDPPPNFQTDLVKPDINTDEISQDYYMLPSNEQGLLTDANQIVPTEVPGVKGLDFFKAEDMKHFGKLLKVDDETLDSDEKKEVESMRLILKIKNGSQLTRKKSMRQLTDNAAKFGPKLLLNQILPILLEPTLNESERHILVKIIGRILFQLDDQIRPYTSKILSVISPFLIDEDATTRLETREIIQRLTKAVGLANIISTLRPDLDHADEYVRNLTSRIFATVANTIGLKSFLPFLKAVIKSKKNWTARHTGIKIIQQLCILLGKGNGSQILPFLSTITEILRPTINDESLQVRLISVLTISQLAENVAPYGMDSFEKLLEPLWFGIKKHRGKSLAGFSKCIGAIIPLMTFDENYEEYSNYYSTELIYIITKEFNSPDEDMRKTILRIIISLPLSRKLIPDYSNKIIQPFFKSFWNRRTASDNAQFIRLVVDATNHLAIKFDFLDLLEHVIYYSKDDNEQLRKLSIETINKMLINNPQELIGMDSQLDRTLVDGVLFAFQQQTIQNKIYLQCFGTLAKSMGIRLKPHLNSIMSTVLFRMKNKISETRQDAADLISILAPVIKICYDDDELLLKLILVLYESLGEVYPEVLGSIINALYSCINSVDKSTLYAMNNPSINQILPTLTPILKNRQEKVQESCIKLIGLIAQKNPETINAKEWMRISFDLLEMLKSTKRRIRIAANATFGYISNTIGPQDIIVMLLNNLKVQERQLRVCTAVAIGIVAETCSPFTVLPAIMNEYRIPEKNVQNGVLKALSFLFEYIDGNMTKDYLFAITPLIEDALTDRDLVHRQIASTIVFHMALNCYGKTNTDYNDVFIHFLNLILPNILETSPHVISRILESIDSLRVVLGAGIFTNYVWAGLFHPARKVRTPYWKVFNSAYVQNCDALVPYYPRFEKLPDEKENEYYIDEMDLYL